MYTTRGLYFLTNVTEKRQAQKPKKYFIVLLVAKIGNIYFLNCHNLALNFYAIWTLMYKEKETMIKYWYLLLIWYISSVFSYNLIHKNINIFIIRQIALNIDKLKLKFNNVASIFISKINHIVTNEAHKLSCNKLYRFERSYFHKVHSKFRQGNDILINFLFVRSKWNDMIST